MGLIRKYLSVSTAGLVHWHSNGEKLVQIAKINRRDAKVRARKAQKALDQNHRQYQQAALAEEEAVVLGNKRGYRHFEGDPPGTLRYFDGEHFTQKTVKPLLDRN
jgi:hypothetical protein